MTTINRFLQALHAVKLNTVRPIQTWPHVRVEVSAHDYEPPMRGLQRRVEFRALAVADVWVDVDADGETLLAAHQRAGRHLTEVLFGDLRVALHAIEHALADRDVDKAQRLMTDLYRELFGR